MDEIRNNIDDPVETSVSERETRTTRYSKVFEDREWRWRGVGDEEGVGRVMVYDTGVPIEVLFRDLRSVVLRGRTETLELDELSLPLELVALVLSGRNVPDVSRHWSCV